MNSFFISREFSHNEEKNYLQAPDNIQFLLMLLNHQNFTNRFIAVFERLLFFLQLVGHPLIEKFKIKF